MPSQLDFFQSSVNQEIRQRNAAQEKKIADEDTLQQEERKSAYQDFNAKIAAFEQTLESAENVHPVCHDLIQKARQIASVSNLSRIKTLTQIIDWANQSQQGSYQPNLDQRDLLLNEISKASIFDRPYVKIAASFLGMMTFFALAMVPLIFSNFLAHPLIEIIAVIILQILPPLVGCIFMICEMKAPPRSVGLEVRQLSEKFEVPAQAVNYY